MTDFSIFQSFKSVGKSFDVTQALGMIIQNVFPAIVATYEGWHWGPLHYYEDSLPIAYGRNMQVEHINSKDS